VPKPAADKAFENAACIGCGACVAACPNGSAMLFTSAKVAHLNSLPQGQPERESRVLNMVAAMDDEGFGGCTNTGECVSSCPKDIPFQSIVDLNHEFLRAVRKSAEAAYSVLGKIVTSAAGWAVSLRCLADISCQNIRQNTGHRRLHDLT